MTAVRTAEPGTFRVLVRAAAAEWARMRTVRTTWWCLLAAAVTVVGIGAALGLEAADEAGPGGELPPAWMAGEIALLPGQFALLLVVLLAVTLEYATGAIGPTLQWTPRRGVLLSARVVVPVAAAAVAGVLLALAADLAAWTLEPALELTAAGVVDSLPWIALVLVGGGVLAVGAGLLLRSTAGALATVFLLMLVLPVLLPAFGVGWLTTLAELLPGSGAMYLLLDKPEMSTGRAVALLVGWATAALAAGAWSLLRRDAT